MSTPGSAASEPGRVLMFSQRNIHPNIAFRLGLHEFEDIIREVDSVDMVAPRPTGRFRYGWHVANRLAVQFARSFNPGIPVSHVDRNYDLFLAIVQFTKDLLHIQSLRGWKQRCRTSVCWLNEFWVSELHKDRYFFRLLSEFDYVVVHWAGSVAAVQERVTGKCRYLPYGVDTILFCPVPELPTRVVDVYSIGRRSEATHRTLLGLAERGRIFYIYDTIEGTGVCDSRQHRALVANIAKRSRYFLVNPGKVDAPEETQGQIEFGNRFFEGAAAGTVMVGETPDNSQFRKVFDWDDSVIHLPFGSGCIQGIMDTLDRDEARTERIRTTNVVQSLLRHDWVYRWEKILETVGLKPLPQLQHRKQRLAEMATLVAERQASLSGSPASDAARHLA